MRRNEYACLKYVRFALISVLGNSLMCTLIWRDVILGQETPMFADNTLYVELITAV